MNTTDSTLPAALNTSFFSSHSGAPPPRVNTHNEIRTKEFIKRVRL